MPTQENTMATIPTPEETARELLAILRDDNLRAGQGMPLPALRSRYGNTRPAQDLEAGLRFATEQGWLKIVNSGFFVRFTEAGFNEA
jgi:hypothetical protein